VVKSSNIISSAINIESKILIRVFYNNEKKITIIFKKKIENFIRGGSEVLGEGNLLKNR